jgi:hypothetical protein
MIMELTKQIAMFLDENGFGTFDESGLTGDIFINAIPNKPNQAMAVFSTGGPSSDPRGEYGRASIQILIRSNPSDPRSTEEKAQQIVDRLHGFNSGAFTIGGNIVFDTSAQQSGPNNIGPDENGRFEFSQNFIIEYVK